MPAVMDQAQLTHQEARLLEVIAELEAEGRPTWLDDIAERAGFGQGETRAVLTRLLNDLGLVQEVPGTAASDVDFGSQYVLTGRGGAVIRHRGGDIDHERLPVQLGRYVGKVRFPASHSQVVDAAVDADAPEPLVQLLKRLPDDRRYLNLQHLADAVAEQME
jgi:hypothetical protein